MTDYITITTEEYFKLISQNATMTAVIVVYSIVIVAFLFYLFFNFFYGKE